MFRPMSFTVAVLLLAATFAHADQVNLVFSFGATGSMLASSASFDAGPAPMIEVTDSTRNITKTLAGSWTAMTGPASSIIIKPGQLLATYTLGGADSVLITDTLHNVLVSGIMRDGSNFAANEPQGTAAFSGEFLVTSVSSALLAELGLGPGFEPLGTVSATGGSVVISGTNVSAEIGGGSVTIQTPAPVSEPDAFLLLGAGLVVTGYWTWQKKSKGREA